MKPTDLQIKLSESCSNEPPCECVIRLTTSYWHDSNGCYIKKSLRFLRRKCVGHNMIYEDCGMIGAKYAIERIVNLDQCEDGIYEIRTCNERSDWETPNIIDDYDYKLVPVNE